MMMKTNVGKMEIVVDPIKFLKTNGLHGFLAICSQIFENTIDSRKVNVGRQMVKCPKLRIQLKTNRLHKVCPKKRLYV